MMYRRNYLQSIVQYSKVKQLTYFKNLIRLYNIELIKEIIPFIATQIYLNKLDCCEDKLNFQEYIYIRIDATEYNKGQFFDFESIKQCKKQLSLNLLRINRKIHLILQSMNFKFINTLTLVQQVNFFQQCKLVTGKFGTKVYQVNDEVHSIYLILEGQIKIMSLNRILSCLMVGNFFGYQDILNNKQYRQLSAIYDINETKLLVIPLKLIQKIKQDQKITINQWLYKHYKLSNKHYKLSNTKLQFNQNLINNNKYQNNLKIKKSKKLSNNPNQLYQMVNCKENYICLNRFHQKIRKFQKQNQNSLKDNVFKNYINQKQLILKINKTIENNFLKNKNLQQNRILKLQLMNNKFKQKISYKIPKINLTQRNYHNIFINNCKNSSFKQKQIKTVR